MINNNDYIRLSLELHLFFARIMKEHSFFLGAGFTGRDSYYKDVAEHFQTAFHNILDKAVNLSDGNISNEVLSSNEIVTNNTIKAEEVSSNLSGIQVNSDLTMRELSLQSGFTDSNSDLLNEVCKLNREALPLIQNIIHFKNDILTNVLSCKMYTTNYPLLIEHIMNEAKMYHELLSKLENKEPLTNDYLYEQELFWNNIMKEHAEFIRGLLDPTEKELITAADKFAAEYEQILNTSNVNNLRARSLEETERFKAFKLAGEEGLLNCQIRSIIIPLLADHVLREANHFIRLLNNYKR